MMTQISDALRDGHPEVSGSNPGGTSPRNSGGHVVIFLPALNEEHGIGPVMDRIPRAELEAAGFSVAMRMLATAIGISLIATVLLVFSIRSCGIVITCRPILPCGASRLSSVRK